MYLAAWLAALGLSLVLVCKAIDAKRHTEAPRAVNEMRAVNSLAALPTRRPPVLSGGGREKVARLCQIAHLIRSGDPGTFSGREIQSYVIRIATFSDKSHAFLFDVENEGTYDAVPYIIDTTLKRGVTRRLLSEEVAKYPGQWYWSAVSPGVDYDRLATLAAANKMVADNTRYGWPAILLQAMIRVPTSAAIAYMTGLGSLAFFKRWPSCSGALAALMRKGRLDMCKDRAPELITPQDVNQCPLFEGWVGILP